MMGSGHFKERNRDLLIRPESFGSNQIKDETSRVQARNC